MRDDLVDAYAAVSHRYQLAGKPDHVTSAPAKAISCRSSGKTRRWSGREPRPGDRAQVLAYCLLVEETWGGNVDYGLLKYVDNEFTIRFGNREREEIIALLGEMHAARTLEHVNRSHNQAQRCRKCGVRASCGEASR